jgi:hypothetical protein
MPEPLGLDAAIGVDRSGNMWINNGIGSPRYFDSFAAGDNGDAAPASAFTSSTDFLYTWAPAEVVY